MSLRRRDLSAGAAGLAVLALARSPAAFAQAGDNELIERLLGLERRLAAVYGRGGSASDSLFAEHSREHAKGLELALRNRGGRPPATGGQPDGGSALELEAEAVAACYRACGELRDTRLLPTFAAIMANHGQHLVVLREARGRDPIPSAFETGHVQ
jgi:hypothetical protein